MSEGDIFGREFKQHAHSWRVVAVLVLDSLEQLRQVERERLGRIRLQRADGMLAQLKVRKAWQQELERFGQARRVTLSEEGIEVNH